MTTLNPDSPIPLYHQLARILAAKIETGEHVPGSRIPSEHVLAGEYGIGRPTVRQATDLLIRKGILARKRGAGTFVQAPRQEVDLLALGGTMAAFEKRGIPVSTRIIESMRLKTIRENSENPFFNQRAYGFGRLSEVGGDPVLLEDIFLEREMFKGIDRVDLSRQSLSRVVEDQYFLRPTGGRQNFRVGFLDSKRAALLAVDSDAPILRVSRFIHFGPAQNAVYSDLYCRTDRFVFSQTLGGITHENQGIL
jgi:GntR family transcriptional regulator